MVPTNASSEEIAIFTKRVLNNVVDAAGNRPDSPRFDRFTARFIDEVQDFAKGGLAKSLELSWQLTEKHYNKDETKKVLRC